MKKLLLLSFCLLWSAAGFSQDWCLLTMSDDGITWQVDLSSIDRIDNKIYCWAKMSYDEDARLKEARRLQDNDYRKDKKWLNFSHTLTYDVYDCVGRKSQLLSFAQYDTNGKSLSSHDNLESSVNYKRLIPGTIGMSIFNELNEKHIFEVDDHHQYEVYIENINAFLKEYPDAKHLGNSLAVSLLCSRIQGYLKMAQ